jgi:TetR/AcrR family transcriptional repressor of nem operon
MRYPPDHKEKSRRRILDAAGRAFRRHGFRGAGIDAVMREAGLTKGAFSQHFASKDELLAETIDCVLAEKMAALFARGAGLQGRDWVRAVVGWYLGLEHLDDPEGGCPVPALLSELSRADRKSRAAFARTMTRGVEEFARRLAGMPHAQARKRAHAIQSACFGAVALARAMPTRAQAEEVLLSTRDALLAGL